MEHDKLLVSSGPHITSGASTRKIMLGVILALLPTLIASALIFGWRVLLLTGVTAAFCVAFEFIYCVIMKKPVPIGDFSAIVTGILLAFNLPPDFPLWMACIGAFVSIVVVKQLFGGIGFNFANPALVGRIVLQLSFTGEMINFTSPARTASGIDALAGATPLFSVNSGTIPMIDLLLGTHGGVLGETCALTLIIGGLFMLFTKIITPSIPAAYIGGVFVFKFALLFGAAASSGGFSTAFAATGDLFLISVSYLISGGLLLGAFFMATDYTTSPYTTSGKIVFGIGLAVITVAIREWATMAEGVSYALLLMNLLVPYINSTCRRRPLGVDKGAERKQRKGAVTSG